MARQEGDQWGIAESVGITALGVASARATETASERPLVRDPYAQSLVDGVPDNPLAKFSTPEFLEQLEQANPGAIAAQAAMVDYIASRTKFFDDFFLSAATGGARQAVILASGLDARAWRLDWPSGTTVFEIDLPKVLAYKSETLADQGATPTATLVVVPIDLRDDWPKALIAAGFDPGAPAAWSAEGLLPYLPPRAQDLLFERVAELSAPGSRLSVEAFDPDTFGAAAQERWAKSRALMQEQGYDLDVQDLMYLDDDRADAGEWLAAHGWSVSTVTALELLASYDREPDSPTRETIPKSVFITATKA